jgi:outer membrane biosynthesis protein TonB
MKSRTLFLAIALITAVSAASQTASIQGHQTTIPLDEAEQHLVEHSAPAYPTIAKLAGVEGVVRLTLEVSQSGEVIRVIESTGPSLLLRAAAAVT